MTKVRSCSYPDLCPSPGLHASRLRNLHSRARACSGSNAMITMAERAVPCIHAGGLLQPLHAVEALLNATGRLPVNVKVGTSQCQGGHRGLCCGIPACTGLGGTVAAICGVETVKKPALSSPADPGQGVQHPFCMQAFLQSADSEAVPASRPHWPRPVCMWPAPARVPRAGSAANLDMPGLQHQLHARHLRPCSSCWRGRRRSAAPNWTPSSRSTPSCWRQTLPCQRMGAR